MKFKVKFVWNKTSGWFLGFDWEHVFPTQENPVQSGWLIRVGFGFFQLLFDKWRVYTPDEQEIIRQGGKVS